jgi:hypothetical protein
MPDGRGGGGGDEATRDEAVDVDGVIPIVPLPSMPDGRGDGEGAAGFVSVVALPAMPDGRGGGGRRRAG